MSAVKVLSSLPRRVGVAYVVAGTSVSGAASTVTGGAAGPLSITDAPSATTNTAAQKAGLRMTGGAPLPRGPDGASTSKGLAPSSWATWAYLAWLPPMGASPLMSVGMPAAALLRQLRMRWRAARVLLMR